MRCLAILPLIATLLMTGGLAPRADAQTISNTARIAWTDGGIARELASNRVDIAVTPFQPASIATFVGDPGAETFLPLSPGACAVATAASAAAGEKTAQVQSIATAVRAAATIRSGEQLIVQIASQAANRDPAVADRMTAEVTDPSGDRELLTLTETGPDTGLFVGAIATAATPPAAATGDCRLSLTEGAALTVRGFIAGQGDPIATRTVAVASQRYNFVFDSEDGRPVDGAVISLIDAATGATLTLPGLDGAAQPARLVTGTRNPFLGVTAPSGAFAFPTLPPGRYRIRVEPPAPYTAPSTVTAANLGGLRREDGAAFAVAPASYGEPLVLAQGGMATLDVPVDKPLVAAAITKLVSKAVATPGEPVLYTVTVTNAARATRRGLVVRDDLPGALRLRAGTLRVDGAAPGEALTLARDGRGFSLTLAPLATGAMRVIRYMADVRTNARAGQAINRASVTDLFGGTSTAEAALRIDRETIAGRMTVLGRVVEGGCRAPYAKRRGVGGVRVMLEDGSYAITDSDGRYHFEGLLPDTHVVQLDADSLPAGQQAVDCVRSTRSAGSAISRFVTGQGGAVTIADFHLADAPAGTAARARAAPSLVPVPVSDKAAAGAERDWFAGGARDIAWLFPTIDYNPRAPVTRVAIRHLPGQTVALSANGKPVDALAFDGARPDPAGGGFAVSLWRGVPLEGEATRLVAVVKNADGSVAQTLDRTVHYVQVPARAEYLPAQSRLVADGVSRPVIAVRFVDRNGRPIHAGASGDLNLPNPYRLAQEVDAEQARALSGMERAKPVWRVLGDDGIAYIELAPTSVSGSLQLTIPLRDRDSVRVQQIDTWLVPGDRPWTIVGLADGRLGQRLDPLSAADTGKLKVDGRVAFYAKGRVLGKYLLTMSYDSAKRRDDTRFQGVIDPQTYYTVYADRSERRFDAASVRKLYLKLESRQFYALFGDFETNFTDTELARYVRSFNGAKGELRVGGVAAQAFVATSETRHRRDEIQGNGLSGPYALSARDILANSEQVRIEVRDRFRSELIADQRVLTRYVDYDIDYAAGTLRFREPVLSRSSALDPQFIVVDYELQQAVRGNDVNAGARVTGTFAKGRVRVGATALRDADETGRTTLGVADIRAQLSAKTELRAEVAVSDAKAGSVGTTPTGNGGTKLAWLAEIEHHDARVDVLAYARQLADGYGIAQQNTAERGRRKIGLDGRVRLTDALSLVGSAWQDDSLVGDARRRAAALKLDWRTAKGEYRAGLTYADDRRRDGTDATSTLAEVGATQRLFGNRLELSLDSSFALGGDASVDFPTRHRATARYAFNQGVSLVGSYEIADGDAVKARTARIGFDLKPWAGARLTSAVASQGLNELGSRTYAAYGLAQSLQLGKRWSVDMTVDGNRTLSGIAARDVINPAQPVASGGYVGDGSLITEDFTAVTAGATYRANKWSATGRAEYRAGELGDRAAVTAGLIRQLGEGSALGALASWSYAARDGGPTTRTFDLQLSAAFRPASSPLAILEKLEVRRDQVNGAVAGQSGSYGGAALTVSGDVESLRIVNSFSLGWAPYGRDEGGLYQRSEFNLFVGARYVSEKVDAIDVKGFGAMLGADARVGVGERLELGVSGNARSNAGLRSVSYSIGPVVGVRPMKNTLISVGYNVRGFADRDFAEARYTRQGPFVSMKLKFDQSSFAFLGLGR